MVKQNVQSILINNSTITQQQQQRQRFTDEIYPDLSLAQEKKSKVKLRYKQTLLPATIEDASEDEESIAINDCLFPTSNQSRNLDGRSPHALPAEQLFTNHNFLCYPHLFPKFEDRSLRSHRTAKLNTGLSRGFNEFIMRNKRSTALSSERPNTSFESLSADFLDLPTIPEIAPLRKISEKEDSDLDDEEKKDRNIFKVR